MRLASRLPDPYRRLATMRSVRQPLVGSGIGRLPIAALPLAMVLMIRESTGSFAIAGAVQAAFAMALGVGLPVQGRLIDRFGQTPVLLLGGALNPLALVALVAASAGDASPLALYSLGALSGATTPPLAACMLTLWADTVDNSELLLSAFALDAVVTELAFIAGPLVTALLVAFGSPATAVVWSAAVSLIGLAIFACSRASRIWRNHPRARDSLGPLRSRGIVVLLTTQLLLGVAVGALELSVVAFATTTGSGSQAGLLLAVQAAASLVAGLWYGSRRRGSGSADRYPDLCLLIALGFAPLLFVSSFPLAVPLMMVSGLAYAPANILGFLLIRDLTPRGTLTEASSWSSTALVTGAAAGTAAAGVLLSADSFQRGFGFAVVAAVISWVVAARNRAALVASS